MFGGPFIALMLYFVIGIVVVVPPRYVGDALEKGLTLNSQRSWTLNHFVDGTYVCTCEIIIFHLLIKNFTKNRQN
jgi:alkyl hydroperoxide reductase subunit AhpC